MQMYSPSHFSQHTHTHAHTVSHPFSSPSDELLSCLLDIGSMQPQSCPAANHRTMRWTSPACSAFASGPFNRQPSENLAGGWLGGAWRVGHTWKSKKAREAERGDTHTRKQTHSGVNICAMSCYITI